MQSETDEREVKTATVTLSTEYGPGTPPEPVGDDVWLHNSPSYRGLDEPSAAATAKRLSRTTAGREHLWSRALLHFRHIILPLLLALLVIGGVLIWNWLSDPASEPVAIEPGRSVTTSAQAPSSSPSTSEAAGPIFAEPSFTERTRDEGADGDAAVTQPTTTARSTSTSTSTPATSTPTTTVPTTAAPTSNAPEPDCETTSSKPGKRKGQKKDNC